MIQTGDFPIRKLDATIGCDNYTHYTTIGRCVAQNVRLVMIR
jgi:hypothetical protein